MPQAHLLRSEQGFTLVEIMIAAAMSGFVFLLAAAGMVMFSRGSVQLNRGAMQHVGTANLGALFMGIIETAGVATEYQHVPILITNNGCVPPGGTPGPTAFQPALRIRDGNLWRCPNNDPTVDTIVNRKIEFFRDVDAELIAAQVALGGDGPSTEIISQQGVNYNQALLDGEYYLTWPLKDETSAPFMVLRNTDDDLSFNMLYCADYAVAEAAGDSACNGNTPNRVQFQSNRIISSETIQGSPLLLYNSKDPKQFIIRYVERASSASGAATDTKWNLELLSMDGKLGAIYGAAATQMGYLSNNSAPSWGGVDSGDWNRQALSFYQFPTSYPNLNVGNTHGTDGLIVRQLAGFFDARYPTDKANRPRWIGVPLRMTSIYLLTQDLMPPGCPRTCATTPPLGCPQCNAGVIRNYRLMGRTWQSLGAGAADSSEQIALADHVYGNSAQFTVMIARKLGQSGIEIFASNQ